MEHETCRRCNRKLKNQKAREEGAGRVCKAKEAIENEIFKAVHQRIGRDPKPTAGG